MEFFKDDLDWDYTAKKRFRVIVVGAGIAGLTVAIGKLLGNSHQNAKTRTDNH